MNREHQEQISSSLRKIKSNNKENVSNKIISFLQSEDIDLDQLNEFIQEKRKAKT